MKKHILPLLLVTVLVFSLLPIGVMADDETVYQQIADADDYTVYTKSDYPWDASGGLYTSGNAGQGSTLSNLKIVFKNAGILHFDWTTSGVEKRTYFAYRLDEDYSKTADVTSQEGHKYTGDAEGAESEMQVAEGSVLYVTYCKAGHKDDDSVTDTATITNIYLEEIIDTDPVTVDNYIEYDSTMGTVTAQIMETKKDSYNYSYIDISDVSLDSVAAGSTYRLKAVAKEGYQFYGWVQEYTYNGVKKQGFKSLKYYTLATRGTENIRNEKVAITDPELEVTIDANSVYRAVFAKEDSYVVRVNAAFYGSDIALDSLIDNAASGDVIEILQDTTLTGDATVKKGVTLYVPYRSGWGENEGSGKYRTNGGASGVHEEDNYATLTVNSGVTLTVKGTIAVGSVVGYKGTGYQGAISGVHGRIVNNGDIIITEKGSMVAYGLVTGEGTVLAQDYGVVKESLLVLDFAGGSNSLSLYTIDQMPFKRYAMQNIQCTLQLERYGTLTGIVTIYANSGFNEVEVGVVGVSDNAVFKPNDSGSSGVILTRTYDANKVISAGTCAGVGKTTWSLSGGLTFQSLTIDLGIAQVRTDVADFPIPCHMDLVLEDGTYDIPGKLKFMPGTNVTIEQNAALKISGKLLVMDGLTQTGMSGYYYPTRSQLEASGYSGTGNLYVNGTLQILSGATFGGVVQSLSDTGILIVEDGAHLTNSGDLEALDPTLELSAQSDYQSADWIQQDGGKGYYDDNTTWFNLPARVYDGEQLTALQAGTYISAAADSGAITDISQQRYCTNASTVKVDGESILGYSNNTREMTLSNESFTRTVYGTWKESTSAVEITSVSVAGSAVTGVSIEYVAIRNDDGSTTLTLTAVDKNGDPVEIKYVFLLKYVTATGTMTAEGENGVFTIPAEAISATIESAMLGDVNGDGKIKLADVRQVYKAYASDEYKESLSDLQRLTIDFVQDGATKLNDVRRLYSYFSTL